MKHRAAFLSQQRYLLLYVFGVVVTDYFSEYLYKIWGPILCTFMLYNFINCVVFIARQHTDARY